jgi:hypothetical protein
MASKKGVILFNSSLESSFKMQSSIEHARDNISELDQLL